MPKEKKTYFSLNTFIDKNSHALCIIQILQTDPIYIQNINGWNYIYRKASLRSLRTHQGVSVVPKLDVTPEDTRLSRMPEFSKLNSKVFHFRFRKKEKKGEQNKNKRTCSLSYRIYGSRL